MQYILENEMPDKNESDAFRFFYLGHMLSIWKVKDFDVNTTVAERCAQDLGRALARNLAEEILKILNAGTLPACDYVIIVGQEKQKPNMVAVVVCGKSNKEGQYMAKIERWLPNERLQEKVGNSLVFAVW